MIHLLIYVYCLAHNDDNNNACFARDHVFHVLSRVYLWSHGQLYVHRREICDHVTSNAFKKTGFNAFMETARWLANLEFYVNNAIHA